MLLIVIYDVPCPTVMLPTVPSHKRAASMARHKFAAGTFSDHMALLRAFQVMDHDNHSYLSKLEWL